MAGKRIALIVATDRHYDPTFQTLRAPAQDATSLAEVLTETPQYGYEVTVLHNEPAAQVTRSIERMLLGLRRDDVFLLYFSGHGIKDDAGNLYLATIDSEHLLPSSTMVAAQFVRSQLDQSRCGRKIVLLDCCFGGAFPEGQLPRGKHRVEVLDQLTGRGCAILTASTALEFAYEPDGADGPLVSGEPTRSYFTSALVDGLQTGAADLDGDGWIDSDELHRYIADELHVTNPRQNPSYDCKFSGRLVVASNPCGPRLGYGLPDEIALPLRSPLSGIRVAVAHYLLELASGDNVALSLHAQQALAQLALDTNPEVRAAAATFLDNRVSRPWFAMEGERTSGTHMEAIQVATQQTGRFEFLANFMVNLNRRNQMLVHRQLKMLESLESREENPDKLADLFKLDHLLTRAQRNLQNILILADADSQDRNWSNESVSFSVIDVIQAAMAEIEHYARVSWSSLPQKDVLTCNTEDLTHMIAELLDNATAFSAPESRVTVCAEYTESGGLAIQIMDRGIGLTPDDLTLLNQRLANPLEFDQSDAQRLGLYVVARLAHRHKIQVQLQTNGALNQGITALIILPDSMISRRQENEMKHQEGSA
ncbi:caspase family protein [Amycolatopsis sp. MJM2582]|uniref:caspase, EACC1-associated type n=1 Tax=Amycolatopsis sp. MJM2582 TaxID=1427749 RepID=UPI0013771EAD|nr:caspase family protein [Amycolatopsis sp. MJM2582]